MTPPLLYKGDDCVDDLHSTAIITDGEILKIKSGDSCVPHGWEMNVFTGISKDNSGCSIHERVLFFLFFSLFGTNSKNPFFFRTSFTASSCSEILCTLPDAAA